ncbi:MAG: hypothetical protein ACD_65C00318G0002, partial [uncultured bacterium]
YEAGHLVSYSVHAGDLTSILWWIASIIVIWYGTNKMIQTSSSFAAKITDKIHGGVNSFVGGVAGTAKYLPIIPASMGGSISGIQQMPTYLQSHFKNGPEGSDELARQAAAGMGLRTEGAGSSLKIKTLADTPSKANAEKTINDPATAKHLLTGMDAMAVDNRKKFLEAMGYTKEQAESASANTKKFEEFLGTQDPSTRKIGGYEKGTKILKDLEASSALAGDAKTPTTAPKKVEKEKVSTTKPANTSANIYITSDNKTYVEKKGDDYVEVAEKAKIDAAKSGVESGLKSGDLKDLGAHITVLESVMTKEGIAGMMNAEYGKITDEEVKKKIRTLSKETGFYFDGTGLAPIKK